MRVWSFARMPNRHRASVAFVLITLGLDALGVGIIAPIVPGLVRQLAHVSPERAAPWVGCAGGGSYAGVQFLRGHPCWVSSVDRFGRRPVILASVFGLGCDYILLALAPNLWWLFAGRLIAGATSANVPAATAYIADVSSREDRPRLFGLIGGHVRGGLRYRTRSRRIVGGVRPASAVHRCRRSLLHKCLLRTVRVAREPGCRKP